MHTCPDCEENFTKKTDLFKHQRLHHENNTPMRRSAPNTTSSERIKETRSALGGVFVSHSLNPTSDTEGDLTLFRSEITPHLNNIISDELSRKGGVKWYITCKIELTRSNSEGGSEIRSAYFGSRSVIELLTNTIDEHISTAFTKIEQDMENFNSTGSNWIFNRVEVLDLGISIYNPFG